MISLWISASFWVWTRTRSYLSPVSDTSQTCRKLFRGTILTEAQAREMTDEVLEDTIWEVARPWEEQWESLKVNENKTMEQELDDEDRQARFGRRRPDGFAVNEKEHLIYILEFKGRLLPKGHRHPPTHPPTQPHIQWMCSIVGISTWLV